MYLPRNDKTKTMNKKKKLALALFFIAFIAIFPFGEELPIKYVERSSREIKTEQVYGEGWLYWLYNNPIGKLSLYALVKRKVVSDWYGSQMDSPESAEKISGFVKQYNIDLSEAKKQEFNSFNDFFSRELKPNARRIDTNKDVLISPADGKIFAYENISQQDFIVKGYRFNLLQFLNDSALAKKYKNGSLIIVRLCPTDYHRFHFPSNGKVIDNQKIDGPLYSVSPIALRKKAEIICRNKREYTLVDSEDFGQYIIAEVGATMVGSIIQTYKTAEVKKGQEKGYFLFGGSTVVLLFKEGEIEIDTDLIDNTKKQLETEVKMGEKIGEKLGIANLE